MREVLAQIHNIATSLENKKALKQADKLNNIFIKIAEEVEAAKKKKKTKKNVPTNPDLWAQCKAWAKRTFDVYPCVPLDSQALTKYGWAEYSDLNIGDEILTYNQNIDRLEWKPIINLHFYENAPTLSMKKAQTNFKIRCTPDHKWVLKTPNVKYPTNLVEAKNITKRMNLKTAAEIVDDVNSNLNLSEWRKGDDWIKNVLSMSKPQLEAFFAAGIVYDGHDKGLSSLNRSTYGFSQKNSNHGQAMEIAAVLLGYRVSFITKSHNTDMISWTFIKRDSESTGNLVITEDENCDVWCPETENNTWVMKQGRIITITGNSAYANGAAAKRYKAKGGSWKKASNDSQIRVAEAHDDIFTKLYNLIDHLDENMDDSSLDEIKKLIEKLDHSDEKQDLNDHEDMTIEAEMHLEDALNNFDSGLYLVDPHGDWQEDEWISIEEYIELLEKKFGDNILDAPAAIDANHIAFESPDGFQVINLVHKSMLDTGDKGPIPDED